MFFEHLSSMWSQETKSSKMRRRNQPFLDVFGLVLSLASWCSLVVREGEVCEVMPKNPDSWRWVPVLFSFASRFRHTLKAQRLGDSLGLDAN